MAASRFVFLIVLFSLFSAVLSQPHKPRGLLIDCGASAGYDADGLTWVPDTDYVALGVPRTLAIPGLIRQLSTVRTFPFRPSTGLRKFCYAFPVYRGAKYLVRTTFFYGGVNGRGAPPVFDLIVDGTRWAVVNTTADYEQNMSSNYEGVYMARGWRLSVCLGGNVYTESDPFISAIELIILDGSVYNTTDFSKQAMGLVARTSFGHNGPIFRSNFACDGKCIIFGLANGYLNLVSWKGEFSENFEIGCRAQPTSERSLSYQNPPALCLIFLNRAWLALLVVFMMAKQPLSSLICHFYCGC